MRKIVYSLVSLTLCHQDFFDAAFLDRMTPLRNLTLMQFMATEIIKVHQTSSPSRYPFLCNDNTVMIVVAKSPSSSGFVAS